MVWLVSEWRSRGFPVDRKSTARLGTLPASAHALYLQEPSLPGLAADSQALYLLKFLVCAVLSAAAATAPDLCHTRALLLHRPSQCPHSRR